jgi:hypothetical protein
MSYGQRVLRLSKDDLVNPPDLMSPTKFFIFSGARNLTHCSVVVSISEALISSPVPSSPMEHSQRIYSPPPLSRQGARICSPLRNHPARGGNDPPGVRREFSSKALQSWLWFDRLEVRLLLTVVFETRWGRPGMVSFPASLLT